MPIAGAPDPHDRIVVGAGMSGLAYAWWCAARGEDVLLLDAAPRAGGVIETEHRDGYRIERAATTLPSSATHAMALCADVSAQLLPARSAARRQFILGRRGLAAVPRDLVRSELGPWGALRAISEMTRGRRRVNGGESLHTFVRRRFGAGTAESLLRPFTSGIYGAAPERLGAADAFPRLAAFERRRGSILRALLAARGGARREVLVASGGTESIPRAVARALGTRVRLGEPVRRLELGDDDRPAVIELDSGERTAAREVTLAIPAWAQAALLAEHHPHVAQVLDTINYAPIAVVALGFPAGRAEVPDGFGFLRGPRSRARILGATFNARLNPEDVAPEQRELLTVFLGGTDDPGALDLEDDALRAIVIRDIGAALGGRVEPELFDVRRWPRAIPMAAVGHRGRMARAAAALEAGRVRLLGSHVTGISVNDCCRPLAPFRRPLPDGLVRV